ncbi:hypothetical protein DEGR_02650 [Deinococcus grandis]|nr:hypothetical protein DEGR_02650 [Deinococcus grandis]
MKRHSVLRGGGGAATGVGGRGGVGVQREDVRADPFVRIGAEVPVGVVGQVDVGGRVGGRP